MLTVIKRERERDREGESMNETYATLFFFSHVQVMCNIQTGRSNGRKGHGCIHACEGEEGQIL